MDVSIANGWPLRWQLDGSANQLNNCGENCIDMIERWLYGPSPVLVSPDTIRQRILGPNGYGYTLDNQLSDYLSAHGIPSHWKGGVTADFALDAVYRAYLPQRKPNITLFYSNIDAQTGGHFCDVVAVNDDGSVVRANPWTDQLETLSYARFQRGFMGWYVQIDIDPMTFRRQNGLLPVSQVVNPPTAAAVAVPARKPIRYRVLADGALHNGPSLTAPVTCKIKQGWEVLAVSGDSAPWASVKTLNGKWGWDLRSNLVRAA